MLSLQGDYGELAWLVCELEKHYRPSRFKDRGSEYMKSAINSHIRRMSRVGWTALSSHDEITGRGVRINSDRSVNVGEVIDARQNTGVLTHLF